MGGLGTSIGGVVVESGEFDWSNGRFPVIAEPSPAYHGLKFHETFGTFGYLMKLRAETLREGIKGMDIQHRGKMLGSVSASMGVAIFPEHGKTGDALLRAADAALYASKDDGGDRVSTAVPQRGP